MCGLTLAAWEISEMIVGVDPYGNVLTEDEVVDHVARDKDSDAKVVKHALDCAASKIKAEES